MILSEYLTTVPQRTAATTEPTETTPTPFTTAIGLFGIYGHNFFGKIENFDIIRYGVTGALGLHLAPGYIAPALRIGGDVFLGKKFMISAAGVYVGTANILINNEFVKTDGGAGGDVTISYSF